MPSYTLYAQISPELAPNFSQQTSSMIKRAMNRTPDVTADFKVDPNGKLAKKFSALGQKSGQLLGKAFLASAASVIGGAAIFKKLVEGGADLSAALSTTNTIFKKQGKAMQDWSKTAAKAFGLSRSEALK